MPYPTGITSFTTKNAGETIQPAHVNDLQTEVTAIETDLINGMTGAFIANNGLQSSNSTVNGLQVGGNSTFASSTMTISTQTYIFPSSRASTGDVLTVASTSGSTATLQWRAGVTRPVCMVRHSAVTQIAAGAWTGLNWDTAESDEQDMHSSASNSSRITFAHSTGRYEVGVNVEFGSGAGATGAVVAMIRLNDARGVFGNQLYTAAAGAQQVVSAAGMLDITSTADFVTVAVYPGPSTNRIVDSTASTLSIPRFWAHRVG